MKIVLFNATGLEKCPEWFSPRQNLCVSAIKYSCAAIQISYNRLLSTLTHWDEEKYDQDSIFLSLTDAWSVVDNFYRLHSILRRFPGARRFQLNEIDRTLRIQNETLRHYFQHMEAFADPNTINAGLIGGISWMRAEDSEFRSVKIICVFFGSVKNSEIQMTQIPQDGHLITRPVGHVSITIGHQMTCLSDAAHSLKDLVVRFSEAMPHFREDKRILK